MDMNNNNEILMMMMVVYIERHDEYDNHVMYGMPMPCVVHTGCGINSFIRFIYDTLVLRLQKCRFAEIGLPRTSSTQTVDVNVGWPRNTGCPEQNRDTRKLKQMTCIIYMNWIIMIFSVDCLCVSNHTHCLFVESLLYISVRCVLKQNSGQKSSPS